MLELAHCIELVFSVFLTKLQQHPVPTNRDEAFQAIKTCWSESMLAYGASTEWLHAYLATTMTEECGWRNLDADPCYWDNQYRQSIRIYVHRNGTIIMQRKNSEDPQILFSNINGFIAKGNPEPVEPL